MRTIEAMGQTFTIHDAMSATAMIALADVDENASMSQNVRALRDLLKDGIVPDDWDRFQRTMTETRLSLDGLQEVFQVILEAQSERPTSAPSDSSDGRAVIEPKPVASSDDKVSELFPGRPDLQTAIHRTA